MNVGKVVWDFVIIFLYFLEGKFCRWKEVTHKVWYLRVSTKCSAKNIQFYFHVFTPPPPTTWLSGLPFSHRNYTFQFFNELLSQKIIKKLRHWQLFRWEDCNESVFGEKVEYLQYYQRWFLSLPSSRLKCHCIIVWWQWLTTWWEHVTLVSPPRGAGS